MKVKFIERFIEEIKTAYPNILIGYEIVGDRFGIYHYLENFDFNDNDFQEVIGGNIIKHLYENEIYNFYLFNVLEEEKAEYFPEYSEKFNMESIMMHFLIVSHMGKKLNSYVSREAEIKRLQFNGGFNSSNYGDSEPDFYTQAA